MKVEGRSNESNSKRYTMKDLNITEGSPAASIFNRIDEQDGYKDGYLREDQYKEYTAEIDKFKIDFVDKKIVKNESKNKGNAENIKPKLAETDKKIKKEFGEK